MPAILRALRIFTFMNRICIILVCLVLLSVQAPGQLLKRRHAKHSDLPPKAILVELSVPTSRLEFYKKRNDVANIALLKADAAAQQGKMISDFRDHFTYCPVYYFYDTDQDKVKAKDLSVLMNDKLQPATNLVISAADSDYFIVYYGYQQGLADSKNEPAMGGDTRTKNLVALADDFTPLPTSLPYKPRHVGRLRSKKATTELAGYSYQSKKFDISYEPYALLYSRNLSIYYQKRIE